MINRELLLPKSIVVIGGSNNVHKPGGAVVRNLINGGFDGTLRVVNPKEDEVQGIKVFHDAKELPPTELAILVIPAKLCPDTVEVLAKEKGVRAFIIISAGFGEETKEGAQLEQRILDTCEQYGASLIGPNCIGLLTRHHHSVFTKPIPHLNPKGVDFISGSGATAVFILESAVIKGLQFNSVWSIGNGKQIGIEDVLQYMDDNFDAECDSHVKLLYIENIANPDKLLFHAASLIRKGCRIAAIKAGSSESGSRAASSHTGALASSDAAVEALFRKAGIVRCFSREELTTVGCVFHAIENSETRTSQIENGELRTERFARTENGELRTERYDYQTENGELRTERYDYLQRENNDRKTNGKSNHTSQLSILNSQLSNASQLSILNSQLNHASQLRIAIVTHAGGPGVMLTDALSKGGLQVPKLEGPMAEELKSKLFPGSSVQNPIDILATGTPEHLGLAIDYCERYFDNIDVIMVIFGTPGLVTLYEAYDMLHKKILECRKPIFPILPSLHTAGPEVEEFLRKGHVNFSDEVTLATALTQILQTPPPAPPEIELFGVDVPRIRDIISLTTRTSSGRGDKGEDAGFYLDPDTVRQLLSCAGIPMVQEKVSTSKDELAAFAQKVGYPVVAKVVGPVHKSDVGGVTLNIRSAEHLLLEFDRMMQIPDATAVMVQKMVKGTELFIGAKYEERFGHVVLCGLGGIFVEVLKDVKSGLAPLSYAEAYSMIRSLRGYKILKGTRGQRGINEHKYAEVIVRLSTLLRFAREIKEMDINPLLADENGIVAVDARIRIEKS